MKELDVSGFISELNSILRDEKNKKPVRITIKKCKLSRAFASLCRFLAFAAN